MQEKGTTKLVLTENAQLQLRVQCLERAISRVPFLGLDYANELKKIGLEKLDLHYSPSRVRVE